jgi:hypothetical protein
MLATFLRLKSKASLSTAIDASQQQMKAESGIDVESMLEMSPEELAHFLKRCEFTESHLEILVAYFSNVGKAKLEAHELDGIIYLQKSITILDYIDVSTRTASLIRIETKQSIQNLIDSHEVQ